MAIDPSRNHRRLAAGLAAIAIGAIAASSRADDAATGPLPRRGWLGAALESAEGGVRIRAVLPGSSAESAGLKPGDVLTAINGTRVGEVQAAIRALRAVRAGGEVKAELVRDDRPTSLAFSLKGWPREPGTDRYEVDYGAVPSREGRLRSITFVPRARPEGQRLPALLVIQGLGAATLDNPRPDEPIDRPTGLNVYRAIAATLADAGFVAMRVDKAGCGDSEGDAPALDFVGELDGYRQALKALRARPDVDPDRVFLFGHSMGGAFGPIVAGESPVRGVAVYGTVIKTWLEYMLENERRQHTLAGGDLATFDRGVRLSELFHHELIVRKRPPAEILRDHPEIGQAAERLGLAGDRMFGRHYTFFQQLADVNLPEAWSKVDADVLALWGEAEFVTAREDHEWIAAIVNRHHEGRGHYRMVPESDHGFSRFDSPRDAIRASLPGQTGQPQFNPAILEVLKTWMTERAK